MCKINYFNMCKIQYKLESEKISRKIVFLMGLMLMNTRIYCLVVSFSLYSLHGIFSSKDMECCCC